MERKVRIIGAGLAGSEAAWQAASLGVKVELYEMRPDKMTAAHRTGSCAELVCSNSFRGAALANAVGLLKAELQAGHSLFMEAALQAQVPGGGALAVDRLLFSRYIDEKLLAHPLITFTKEEVLRVPGSSEAEPLIIAAGPLCSPDLASSIEALLGGKNLAFFDAISPIIVGTSIDFAQCFRQSRYDKGGDDYLNIPLDRVQYEAFVDDVIGAEKFEAHCGDVELKPFEGCMPIEDMAARGKETLLFGPLKPVGLIDPQTGKRPHAVIQLRQDDREGFLWSMVGLQTRMKHAEQLRVFRSLPGLQRAEFVRLGSVHRNTFINSPRCLKRTLDCREQPGLFFAGQITGTEGYVEAAAGGWLAGINAARMLESRELLAIPESTAMGSLFSYISDPARRDFQPMNASFGLIKEYQEAVAARGKSRGISKKDRRLDVARRAVALIEALRCEEIKRHQ